MDFPLGTNRIPCPPLDLQEVKIKPGARVLGRVEKNSKALPLDFIDAITELLSALQ
jgi:hypothetical protein